MVDLYFYIPVKQAKNMPETPSNRFKSLCFEAHLLIENKLFSNIGK